ncbi:MAG: Uma2 family endonuclease [Gammaproteobacteria bacterium]|nr:Uma2 family endonuclease [Gammaproteobacteria bacterium]
MPPAESQPAKPARLRAPLASQPRRVPVLVEYAESDGKPMAESIIHLRVAIDVITPLQNHYRGRLDAFVGGNLMMYYEEGNPRRSVSPDVFVTLEVPSEPPRPTWKVWEEGKLADFVLEVTSKMTRGKDEGPKKRLYQRLGVSEYWQFDPTGDYLNPKLKGQRLRSDGQYAQIALEESQEGLRGKSAVLGLELRLEDGRLRFFDPEASEYLLTSAEQSAAIRKKSAAIEELDRARLAAERRVAELERRLADLSPD